MESFRLLQWLHIIMLHMRKIDRQSKQMLQRNQDRQSKQMLQRKLDRQSKQMFQRNQDRQSKQMFQQNQDRQSKLAHNDNNIDGVNPYIYTLFHTGTKSQLRKLIIGKTSRSHRCIETEKYCVTNSEVSLFLVIHYILVNKRNDTKIFLKYIFMLKPKRLFIIIYVNVCVKTRFSSHLTNYNILFRYGKIPENQFPVQ